MSDDWNPYKKYAAEASEAPAGWNPHEKYATANPAAMFSPSYEEGRKAPYGVRMAASAAGGTLIDMADRIAGGVNAVARIGNGKSVKENYQSGRDYVRGAADQYGEDAPIMSKVNKFVAALPTAMVGGPIRGMGFVDGAKIGAGYGAVSGFGSSRSENPATLFQDTMSGAGVGAVAGGVLTPLAKGIGWAGARASRALDEALMPKGSARAVGRIANEAAGDLSPTIQNALRRGAPDETASQAALHARSPEFTAMDRFARDTNPRPFKVVDDAQEEGRRVAIKRVTPDLKQSEEARKVATKPLYDQANNTKIRVSPEMEALFKRIEDAGVMGAAEKSAKIDGRPFTTGTNTPAWQVGTGIFDASGREIMRDTPAQSREVTGESLHQLKRALTDLATGVVPDHTIKSDIAQSARRLLPQYLKEFEKGIPVYRDARTTYAKLSAPVNQSEVLTEMSSVLNKPGGGERAGPFLNALTRGEKPLLKRSTGDPRYGPGDLDKVLSREQVAAKNRVVGELEADMVERDLASRGAKAFSKIVREDNSTGISAAAPRTAAVGNMLLRRLGGKGGDKVDKEIGRLMLPENKNELARLMKNATPKERNKLYKAIAASAGRESGGGLTRFMETKDDR